MMQNWRIDKGFEVYDSNDNKIGTVKDVMGNNYFHTDTGFLGLGKDYYIPFSAIRDVRENRVYVSTPKDRLDNMGWDRKPSGGIGGTSERGPF